MKRPLQKIADGVAVGAVIAFGVAVGVGVAHSDTASEPAPPRPPWVTADGTVDLSKMPSSVGVLDANGEPVLNRDGTEFRVDPRKLRPPLPDGPAQPGRNGIHAVDPGSPEVPVRGFVK